MREALSAILQEADIDPHDRVGQAKRRLRDAYLPDLARITSASVFAPTVWLNSLTAL
jgi:hypothetical protein